MAVAQDVSPKLSYVGSSASSIGHTGTVTPSPHPWQSTREPQLQAGVQDWSSGCRR